MSFRKIVTSVLVTAVLGGAVALLVAWTGRPPDGPEPVAWGDEPCAECRMHVDDRRFAAQLQATDGRTLNFDDVGCLFRFVARERPPVHAVHYRHLRDDRWIPEARVRFVPVDGSPMNYGLGAVDRMEEGSLSLGEARRRVLGRSGR
jgi:copper chaperone NosL